MLAAPAPTRTPRLVGNDDAVLMVLLQRRRIAPAQIFSEVAGCAVPPSRVRADVVDFVRESGLASGVTE